MSSWSLGSRWFRWDPHLHTPGTLRNDQFGDEWDEYLQAIEDASPAVAALGVTDYFVLRGYKGLREETARGRLPSVQLIFPNVEVRLAVQTEKRAAVNVHLLVCPDEADHVNRIEELLATLKFHFSGNTYACTEAGLTRLGRDYRGDQNLEAEAALREGANQFKLVETDLFRLQDEDAWFRKNVLIAVAAGADGLGGLRDTSFTAKRQELGRRADFIFSANPKDRDFWAGHHPDFASLPFTPKPCLHGCDCHQLEKVLKPTGERRCWIRAEVSFDGLRQTLVEPERRVHIGPTAPAGPGTSDVIVRLTVTGADWFAPGSVEFNGGLVTIIGMKGSGKTALADLIAAAADASDNPPGPASFILKAGALLDGQSASLEWADGTTSSIRFGDEWNDCDEPRVRYLSQQFVDQLCSPAGELARPLAEEMERVVFEAIPLEERLNTYSFDELRETELHHIYIQQAEARHAVETVTNAISADREKTLRIPTLNAQLKEVGRQEAGIKKDLENLVSTGDKARQKEFDDVSRAGRDLSAAIAEVRKKAKRLNDLKVELGAFSNSIAQRLTELQTNYADLLDDAAWKALSPTIPTTTKTIFEQHQQELEEKERSLKEKGLPPLSEAPRRNLAALRTESERLRKLIGLDEANAKRRDKLNEKAASLESEKKRLETDLKDAEAAKTGMEQSKKARMDAYEALFTAIGEEVRVLERLYSPLRTALEQDARLKKLTFYVHRSVDVEAWAERGEDLLDLRRSGSLQGRGALLSAARAKLVAAWESGTPAEARAAMEAFSANEGRDALGALSSDSSILDFADWLFSTEHIKVEYGIRYGGVALERLSPGTRGIVLLTLYLGLDKWDTRPLVIDQPEENLDPQSIYDELVEFFRSASDRRQIIMVTHNANLVVNTDSDQVIVASSARTQPDGLPTMSYIAGPLEQTSTREAVCRILEGGEMAFRRRGQRYGIATTRRSDS